MTTSVCMGTYNGEKYIEEQLLSILHQTKVPDEVIICDDCSNDGTVERIEKFIGENRLEESWHLQRNRDNKGYPANFYYAMSLCTMDVVFLADQDDIWCEGKLEQMCMVLEHNPQVYAVSCKFGLIDASGANIQTIMAPTRNRSTGRLKNITIEDVFYKYEWPGMVVAYRNAWYKNWELFDGSSKIPHDFLICARAAEEDAFVQMDEELAYHRRHDNNVGGEEHRIQKLLNKARKLKEIGNYLVFLEAFVSEEALRSEKGRLALEIKYASMKGRYKALKAAKMSRVVANAWKYRKNTRLVTVICDMIIARRQEL